MKPHSTGEENQRGETDMAKQKELNMNVCNMNPWQKQFLALMGIVDEGGIVSLVDYEEREEFDIRLYDLMKEGRYGRSI